MRRGQLSLPTKKAIVTQLKVQRREKDKNQEPKDLIEIRICLIYCDVCLWGDSF